MNRRTTLAVVTAVAVIAAALGWFAGQRIKSPADIAAEAEAPEASLITVPVEQRDLSSNIVTRGQVAFTESTDISITGSADGVAIVTRLPKAEGEQLAEGDVVVEVAGRPVIVLQGELPVFRSLTPTLEGPDVRQLEESLVRLGFDPGPVDGTFDASTEEAVAALYRQAGYSPDEPSADDLDRVEQARRTLRDARSQQSSLQEAASAEGLPQSQRLELDRAVTNAEENLARAREARDQQQAVGGLMNEEEAGDLREHESAVRNAEIDLEVAKAARSEAIAQANETGSQDGITAANEAVQEAQDALNRLEAETGVSFPAAELLFLPNLPSEVQTLRADVGDVPQGPVMTVTGSGLKITASISAADRSLLAEGATAILDDDELGIEIEAVVAFVADNPGGPDIGADRYAVRLEPVDDVPEDAINQSLRVTIPFASTEGEVLAVPLAALSAGADGSSRVEVEREDGTVETVTVVPGLNARALGLVEITPVDGELEAGDRVIVGRNTPVDAGESQDDAEEDVESGDAESDDSESEDG